MGSSCSRLGLLVAMALTTLGCDAFGGGRSPEETLFRRHCAECHGLDGAGNNPVYGRYRGIDLVDGTWFEAGDEAGIESVILEGVFPAMPAFDHLSDSEVRAIADYVRTLASGE